MIVIDQIIHEETHTALIIDQYGDHATVMLNHPDEQRRNDYEGNHAEWYDRDCPECDTELRICESWEGEEDTDLYCHECETELAVTEDREVLVE